MYVLFVPLLSRGHEQIIIFRLKLSNKLSAPSTTKFELDPIYKVSHIFLFSLETEHTYTLFIAF